MKDDDWHFPRSRETAEGGDDLLLQMLDEKNVRAAWQRVLANDGAPGPDGLGVRDLAPVFAEEWTAVASRLRSGTWQPQPVRRVSIPKPGGGLRVLGIPSVMDRTVQQAITQPLTRLWEPRFSPRSFAYRRGRGARQALESLASQAAALPGAICCHLDIRQFFDRVPRGQALQTVSAVCDDLRVHDLVQRILDAGACERGQVLPTPLGLPQGSPLSPLLANAVLHPLDLWLSQRQPSCGFVRYADDVLILLPAGSQHGAFITQVAAFLRTIGLELNDEKTSAGPLSAMSFLGFTFWQDGAGRWRRRITPQAWEALHQQLRRRGSLLWTTCSPDLSTPQDYLTGWKAHFGHTECPLDQKRLSQLLAHHSHAASPPPVRVQMSYDGATAQPSAATGATECRAAPSTPAWLQIARLWWSRFRAGRLLRVGLDFQQQRGRHLPRPKSLRLTVLGFTFRLRL